MSRKQIVEEIAVGLALRGVQWLVDGKLMIPSLDDVEKVLDRLHQAVYDGEENTQASTGGILVKKQGSHIDVYLHIGEL